jgi:hypothetical protein
MKRITPLFALALLTLPLAGCELIGGIFKAGIWTGVILVAVAIFAFVGLVKMLGGRRP